MDQKTVFISYRRSASKHLARSIYMDLKANGWDVFFDVNSIDSGDFDRIILNQIGARAHFILLISPDSLLRCSNDGDWVLREIQEAVRLERNIVPIIEEDAGFTREISYLPTDIRETISKKNALKLPNDYFEAGMEKLRSRFLKTPEYITITAPPAAEHAEVQRRIAAVEFQATGSNSPLPVQRSEEGQGMRASRPTSTDLMPAPFAWIDIPNKGYSIAKYPITNAQFAKFIEADCYNQQKWWTDVGWSQRQRDNRTEPLFWTDSTFNDPEQPVVGVSWYDSVAFCLWLSEVTGEKIMLPTKDEWQYAAQGDDGRNYPWGYKWDGSRCNNNVDGNGIGKPTPVRQYESQGDSPFGVVDMAGNVWEWCLTNSQNKTNDSNGIAIFRVARGGSWLNVTADDFRVVNNVGDFSLSRLGHIGFRVSRSS